MSTSSPSPAQVIAATDARLRADPQAALALIDELAGGLLRIDDPGQAARHMVALGSAHLVAEQAERARDVLREALRALPKDDADAQLRARLRLAQAETQLGERKLARRVLSQLPPGQLVGVSDPALRQELRATLHEAGERLAAGLVELGGGAGGAGDPRIASLGRLLAVLSSSAVGTAEPLYATLRAILDESGADRGCLMLYEGAALRLRVGLTSRGQILGAGDFAYSSTIVEQALASREVLLVPDVAQAAPLSQATSARELGLRAAVCVPLRVDRKRTGAKAGVTVETVRGLAGVLYVDAGSAARFGPTQRAFFEACGACAVLAVREAQAQRELLAARERAVPASARGGGPLHRPTGEARRHGLIGRDPALHAVLDRLERVAPTEAAVLIRGESGTGKELLARALHAASPRAAGPFVSVACGALAEDLASSQLFGHVRGAFTDAGEARAGLIEQAHGGTLLLDEVGDLPATVQAALLRVLQTGELRRLGDESIRQVDVRLVTTSQRDLRAAVERGELRQDLLYRIATLELTLPPLRERRDDIPLLVEHLLGGAPIEEAAVLRLLEHPWAGNVRELENVLTRARVGAEGPVALADVDHALRDSLAPARGAPGQVDAPAALEGTLEAIERRVIAERLEAAAGNQSQAARTLGIDRNTLRRKLIRYGITRR